MRVRLNVRHLQDLIARKTLSQNHWAIKLGLSKGHLSNLLQGKHPYPSAHTRERLLDVTGATFDQLFEIESAGDLPEPGVQQALKDRYLLDRAIGQGGMGTVYLARDVRMHRTVAVKVVSPEAVADVGPGALFNEIVRTSGLQHPHILPVFDAGEVEGSPFVVTPYLRDGSLKERLRTGGKLSTDDALAVLGGVAAALDFAHRRGVLHCDVKPANVLLAENHAYLIDFGLARFIRSDVWTDTDRGSELDSGAGTPAYVSPEQARGEPLDARSDVYSLACMMFEMLTGKPPFEGPTTLATVTRRLLVPPPRLTEAEFALPQSLEQALIHGMAVSRDERTPTALALFQECAAALRSAPRVTAAPAPVREYPRERSGPLAGFLQDLGWATRALLRAPVFTFAAVSILALGVGAATSVFSIVNAVILRPLPYPDPGRLVALSTTYRPGTASAGTLEFADQPEIQRATRTLARLGAFAQTQLPLRIGDRALLPVTALVDSGFLPTIGVRPALGRFPVPGEQTVLISHRLWAEALASDPAVLGRAVQLDGNPFTVAGVMPEGFQFPRADAAYFPDAVDVMMLPSAIPYMPLPGFPWFAVGRLAPGVTIAQARQEMSVIGPGLAALTPGRGPRGVDVTPLDQATAHASRNALFIVLGIAGLLLLIATTNVMNLLFSRGAARLKELAIRQAMGATPGRVLRQSLLEAGIIGSGGALVGIVLAAAATGTLVRFSPIYLPVTGQVGIDARVVAFTVSVAACAALLAGAFPALFARARSEEALRSPGVRVVGDRGLLALQRGLCVVQMALGIGLLGGAGVLTHSLWRLNAVDPGYRTSDILGFSLTVPADRSLDDRQRFFQSALDAVRAIPAVKSAGWITLLPPEAKQGMFMPVTIPDSGDARISVNNQVTSPGYFETVGVPIVDGRGLEAGDNARSPAIAVVNQSFARQYLGGAHAVGKLIGMVFDNGPVRRVVGVVRDTHDRGLGVHPMPTVYVPITQFSVPYGSIVLRTTVPPLTVAAEVRRRVAAVDPSVPLISFQTLDDRLRGSLQEPRFYTSIAGVCAGMAVLFVMLGLYGIIAFAVSRRRAEFGVRMAIGAAPGRILRLVLRDGLALAALGLVVGLPLAVAIGRVLRSMLFEVGALDPLTLGIAAGLVVLVTLLASGLPAIRATRVSPVVVLRAE